MSYCRNPYYIYSDGDLLHLDDIVIDENMINVFLYELVEHRKDELNERVKKGKEAIDIGMEEYKYMQEFIDKIFKKKEDNV